MPRNDKVDFQLALNWALESVDYIKRPDKTSSRTEQYLTMVSSAYMKLYEFYCAQTSKMAELQREVDSLHKDLDDKVKPEEDSFLESFNALSNNLRAAGADVVEVLY